MHIWFKKYFPACAEILHVILREWVLENIFNETKTFHIVLGFFEIDKIEKLI